ncbi:hypothetical protein PRJ_5191 [Pseudomonas sp. XWY-1]|nr:hypothetical protein PRJ_5191 [Pseudomonas sp. XWY-1]
MDPGRRVGAGLPAKGPGLLANFHPPFTVAAATVFAGKPALLHTLVVDTRRGSDPGRRRSGFTREEAGIGCKQDLTARLQSPAHP